MLKKLFRDFISDGRSEYGTQIGTRGGELVGGGRSEDETSGLL